MVSKTVKVAALVFLLSALVVAQSIPAATRITVRTSSTLSSGTAKAGERWDGVLAKDLVVGGKTIAKSGAAVHGTVSSAKSSGRLHAPGQLAIRLTGVEVGGKTVAVSTASYRVQGKGHMKSNATKIGGGTAAGAVIGAIAGGGKGAAIGALAGGAAGTGLAAATGKQEAEIPAERVITFTTSAASKN